MLTEKLLYFPQKKVESEIQLFASKIAAIDAHPPVLGWAQTARGRAFEQKLGRFHHSWCRPCRHEGLPTDQYIDRFFERVCNILWAQRWFNCLL